MPPDAIRPLGWTIFARSEFCVANAKGLWGAVQFTASLFRRRYCRSPGDGDGRRRVDRFRRRYNTSRRSGRRRRYDTEDDDDDNDTGRDDGMAVALAERNPFPPQYHQPFSLWVFLYFLVGHAKSEQADLSINKKFQARRSLNFVCRITQLEICFFFENLGN